MRDDNVRAGRAVTVLGATASVAWVQPTFFSRLGHMLVATAEAVGFTHATLATLATLAVVDVIAGLTAGDFDKSMRSNHDPAVWQDVYKPVVGERELYVKFTLDSRGELLLISFKENLP